MRRIKSRPYLTPQPIRLRIKGWLHEVDGRLVPLSNRLPGWDAGSDLAVHAEVELDLDGIYEDCQLRGDARLRLVILWHSAGTRLRGSGEHIDFVHDTDIRQISLTAEIDGKQLANSITLVIKLVMVNTGSTEHRLIPKMSGSILLESSPLTVQLEGAGARFPMEIIDFSTTHFPAEAGWILSWDPDDLHQTLFGDVRLYVNSQHPVIAAGVSEMKADSAGIREAIRLDLAQIIIRGALSNDDFVQNPDRFPIGSVGAVARAMIRLYFDGYSLESVQMLSQSPHLFSAQLQEKLKIFQDD